MTGLNATTRQRLAELPEAVQVQRKIQIIYCDLQGKTSQRTVRPLGCFYRGKVWTLTAWCEARDDCRNFRMDRIRGLELQAARFTLKVGKTLADFLRTLGKARLLA